MWLSSEAWTKYTFSSSLDYKWVNRFIVIYVLILMNNIYITNFFPQYFSYQRDNIVLIQVECKWHFSLFSNLLNGIQLDAEIVHIPEDDTFQAEQKTCYLLTRGVVAIFGPRSKASSEHIKYITDSVEIPYIETRWNYRSQNIIGKQHHVQTQK